MFVACQCNHLEVVEELLAHGADLHSQMIDGATPLFITAQNGHLILMKYLIAKGADLNVRRQVGFFKIPYIRNFSRGFNFRRVCDHPEITKNRHSEK